MYATEIDECVSCEQLIWPGEEVKPTSDGLVCERCADVNVGVALLSH
jgi:recombinational DNA repair protein (RecF pathway)